MQRAVDRWGESLENGGAQGCIISPDRTVQEVQLEPCDTTNPVKYEDRLVMVALGFVDGSIVRGLSGETTWETMTFNVHNLVQTTIINYYHTTRSSE